MYSHAYAKPFHDFTVFRAKGEPLFRIIIFVILRGQVPLCYVYVSEGSYLTKTIYLNKDEKTE